MASSPPSTQEYCLKWNNHQTTIINVMDTLLEEESLVDVTLSADGQLIRAHRIILSACSPYFRTLFKSTFMHDKHPVIVMNGVDFENLKSLVEYMYKGEANVPQHMLSSFIQTAETLQVRGLAEGASKQKLEQVAELHSSTPLTIPSIPPPLNSFKQEGVIGGVGRGKKAIDSISGGILAARLANMVDGPTSMQGMFDLHEQIALAARQQAVLNPPPIKRKKVNNHASPLKADGKSEGLSVKKDLLSKNSKVSSKSQNIMSSGNTLLAAPNNNYESDSDVLKIDEDGDKDMDKDKKDDDIADVDGKENGMDSEEEAMSKQELAERAVPAVGFINPWTGEEIPGIANEDDDSITDGSGGGHGWPEGGSPPLLTGAPLAAPGGGGGGDVPSPTRLKRITNTDSVFTMCQTPEGAKFQCAMCARVFNLKCTLLRHVRHQHQGRFVPHPCKTCGQIFKRTDHLKVHMKKIHNVILPNSINNHPPANASPLVNHPTNASPLVNSV